MKPFRAAVLALGVLLLLAMPGSSYYRIDYGDGYLKWPNATAHMYIDPGVFPPGNEFHRGLTNAMGTWNRVDDCSFRFTHSNATGGAPLYYNSSMHFDGNNSISAYTNLLDPFTYAVTVFDWSVVNQTTDLHDTDLLFNPDIAWSTTGNPWAGDLESVAVHELGHVLGLDHQPDIANSVMYPYIGDGDIYRTLDQDDIDGIRAIYPGIGNPGIPPTPQPDLLFVENLAVTHPQSGQTVTEATQRSTLRISGTFRNPHEAEAIVNTLSLSPGALMYGQSATIDPEGAADFRFDAVVVAGPGEYPVRVRFSGWTTTDYFATSDLVTGESIRVTRAPISHIVQDSLGMDLGPNGEDVVHLRAMRGSKIRIDLRDTTAFWSGEREIEVRDEDGVLLRSARGSGALSLKPVKLRRSKVAVSSPVLTGCRLPSGTVVEFDPPADGLDDFELTEAGAATLLVRVEGGADKRKLKLKLKGTVDTGAGGKPKKLKAKGKLEAGRETVELRLPDLPAGSRITAALKPVRKKKPDAEPATLEVTIRNHGNKSGEYLLLTGGSLGVKKFKRKGTFDANAERIEVVLPALPARTEIDVEIAAGRKATGAPPVVVGYRTPRGLLIEFDEEETSLESFPLNEPGEYRLVLALPDGPSPAPRSFKMKGRCELTDGIMISDL